MSLQDKNEEYVRLPRAWSDWTVTEMIGEGSFGTVYVVERDGEEQALKVIEVQIGDEIDVHDKIKDEEPFTEEDLWRVET